MTQIIERPPMRGDDTPEPRGPLLTVVPSAPTLTMVQAINRSASRFPSQTATSIGWAMARRRPSGYAGQASSSAPSWLRHA